MKPLPKRDVRARADRTGPPRLNATERRALESIEDENLRRVIGELLLRSRDNQDNFDALAGWFPLQPEDAANALRGQNEGPENESEADTKHFWLRWLSGTRLVQSIRGHFAGGAKGEHDLRLRVQGEAQDANHRAEVLLYANDESEDSGVRAIVKGGNTVDILKWVGGKLESSFLRKAELFGKGDLLSASAATTPARLGVGEDGKILVADSSTTTGLKWKTAAEAAAEGPEGRSAGLKYAYLTNTESSDPGSGKLKFNKSTLSEATLLRISETDGDGNAIAPYIATWDDSTSTTKGYFIFRKVGSPTVFAVFSTSGVLNDNGTWDSFTVAHIASNGLTNNDVVTVEFYRTGDKGDTGEKGTAGEKGEKGGTGAEGRWASLRYAYLTNTEETEPAAGKLKFNAGKTALYINETDGDGGGISSYLAAWDDSTTTGTRGFIIIRKIGTPATWAVYKITGALTDKGAWDTLPVALVASNGAFANEDAISVEFYRTGDAGAEGPQGKEGKEGAKGATGERGVGAGLIWEWEGIKKEGEVAEQKARLLESGGKNYLEVHKNAFGIILAAGYIEQWKRLPVGSLFLVQQSQSRWTVYKTLAKATIVEEGTSKEHLKVEVEQVASNAAQEAGKEVSVTTEPILPRTDFGFVTALPSGAAKGDTCSYQAAGLMEEQGAVWQLVHNGTNWTKIGGPPLVKESNNQRETNKNEYTSLATDPLKIEVPLKGSYDIEVGGRLAPQGETRACWLSYAVGTTAASDNWAVQNFLINADGQNNMTQKTRHTGVAASAVIEEKAKSGGAYTVAFMRRRLWVDPVTVE